MIDSDVQSRSIGGLMDLVARIPFRLVLTNSIFDFQKRHTLRRVDIAGYECVLECSI